MDQNSHTELADVVYDAFISYRHNEIDSAAAKLLQQKLEHFHTSFHGVGKSNPIKRVFMDEGELSSNADFELRLRDALKNSRWLIVICSSRLENSYWVNLEIETFLQYHDKSHILGILTSGEPEEVFPSALSAIGIDPGHFLLADARGDTKKEVLRRIRGDVLLKIAAPILETTFDSLKQRHKTYIRRRALAVGSIAGAVLVVFISYILWQSIQIRQQYEIARENQARYLSSISQELSEEGNKEDALLTSLAIQPEDGEEGPVVPEQMYALNTALDSYSVEENEIYDAYHIGECSNPVYGQISDDKNYYYVIDDEGNACVLSGVDGSLLWKITVDDVKEMVDPSHDYSINGFDGGILRILSYDDGKFVLCLKRCLILADCDSQTLLKEFYLGAFDSDFFESGELYSCSISESSSQVCCSQNENGDHLVAFTEDPNLYESRLNVNLYVVNLDTQELLVKKTLGNEDNSGDSGYLYYTVNSMAWNGGGTQLAIGLSYQYSDGDFSADFVFSDNDEYNEYVSRSNAYLAGHEKYGLVLYDVTQDLTEVISEAPVQSVSFANDYTIAYVQYDHQTNNSSAYLSDFCAPYTCRNIIYNLNSDAVVYTGPDLSLTDLTSRIGMFPGQLSFEDGEHHCVLMWMKNTLSIVDIVTGETLVNLSYESEIAGAACYDDSRIIVLLSTGKALIISKDDVLKQRTALDLSLTDVTSFSYAGQNRELIIQTDQKLLFCTVAEDKTLKSVDYSEGQTDGFSFVADSCEYYTVNGTSYRCVLSEPYSARAALKVYVSGTDECVYSYYCEHTDTEIKDIYVGGDDTDEYILFRVEDEAVSADRVVKASLSTGKELIDRELPSETDIGEYALNDLLGIVGCSADMSELYLSYYGTSSTDTYGSTYIVVTDIYGSHMEFLDVIDTHAAVAEDDDIFDIRQAVLTGDGKYLAILWYTSRTEDDSYPGHLCFYNLETEEFETLNEDQIFDEYEVMVNGLTSSKICLYDDYGSGTVYIVDAASKEIVTYEGKTDDHTDVAFFDNDAYLLISVPGSSVVNMIDTSTGETVFSCTDVEYFDPELIVGQNDNYFALLQSAYSESNSRLYSREIMIFYVDGDGRIYPYAKVQRGNIDLNSLEVSVLHKDSLYYSSIYDYKTLKTTALKYLNGKTLSEEKQKEYFVN